MGWLWFFGIILILILIGHIPIVITVLYQDEPQVFLRVLFFRARLVPGKKKKINLKQYRIDRFRKMRLQARAKAREKARRAAAKKAAKQAKKQEAARKAAEARKAGTLKKKSLKQRFRELKGKADFGLKILREVAVPLIQRFGRSLHIKIYRLRLVIATEDAAKTAQAYGIACAAVSDLLALMEQVLHLQYPKDATVSVTPDFVASKPTFDVKVEFRLRIRNILALPFGAAFDFLKLLIHKS